MLVIGFRDKSAAFWYNVIMKAPKNAKTLAAIERMNIYLRDNPTCKLEDAGKVLDIKSCTVRKWKQYGWITHETKAVARRKAQEQAPPLLAATQALASTKKKTPSGVVVPSSVVAAPAIAGNQVPDSLEGLIAKGKDLKISEIRALVKAHLVAQVGDAKAVSNYAAGLKALSGVQDVELEDIYESENMIRIYVPAEDVPPPDILEVDPIEY